MNSFLLLWIISVVLISLLLCCRCTVFFYLLGVVYVILLGVFFGLRHYPNTENHKDEFFNNFVVGGHRGSPSHAPENSFFAFQKAVEEGCQFVEFDIQLSGDGAAVILHDKETGRVSDVNISVSKSTWSMIKGIQLKSVGGVNATIPSFMEIVEWCEKNRVKMIFDVKDGETKLLRYIAKIISEKNLYSLTIVSSFNPLVPYFLKWYDRRILTGFTNRRGFNSMMTESQYSPRGHIFIQWLLEIIDTLTHLGIETFIYPRFLGVDMLLLNHRDISVELADQARQFGIYLVAWTVNDETEMYWFRDVAKIPFLTDEPYKMK